MLFSPKIILKGFSDFLISKVDKNTFPVTTLWWTGSPFQNIQSWDLLMIVLDKREDKRSERKANTTVKKIRHSIPSWIPSIFLSVPWVCKKCHKSVTRAWFWWDIPHWKIWKRELNIYFQLEVNSSRSWTPEMTRLLSSRFGSGGGMGSSPQRQETCTLKPCEKYCSITKTILN